MSRVRQFAAALLLALWLPATLHCGVEALGLSFGTDCCTNDSSSATSSNNSEDCATDGCATIESGFRASSSFTSAPAPLLSCAICYWIPPSFPDLAPLSAPARGVIEALAAPPEISRSRVFVMRAAPLPGAPSQS